VLLDQYVIESVVLSSKPSFNCGEVVNQLSAHI